METAKEVYLKTCKKMKIKPERTLMIAAHGWDINGAKLAGLKTAYITRYENLVIFTMTRLRRKRLKRNY